MKLQERERETGKRKGKGEKGENKWAKNQTLKKILSIVQSNCTKVKKSSR